MKGKKRDKKGKARRGEYAREDWFKSGMGSFKGLPSKRLSSFVLVVILVLSIFVVLPMAETVSAQPASPPAPAMEQVLPEGVITGDTWNVLKGTVDFVYDFHDPDGDLYDIDLMIYGPAPYNTKETCVDVEFQAVDPPTGSWDAADWALANMLGITSVTYSAAEEKWTITVNLDKTLGTGEPNPWGLNIGDPIWPAGRWDFYFEVRDQVAKTNEDLYGPDDPTVIAHRWGYLNHPPDYAHYVYSFHSIQTAIDFATAGDTINVHDGTYNEKIVVDKSLTLKAASSPIIDGQNTLWVPAVEISAADVTLQGFTIQNFKADIDHDWAAVYVHGDSAKIKDNTIKDISSTTVAPFGIGIDVWTEAGANTGIQITNNVVHDVGSIGVRVRHDWTTPATVSNNILLDNNRVYSTGNSGVLITGYAKGVTIKGNEIYESLGTGTAYNLFVHYGASDITIGGSGNHIHDAYSNIVLAGCDNVTIKNNTIEDATPLTSKGKNIYILNDYNAWTGTKDLLSTNVTIEGNSILNADGWGVRIRNIGAADPTPMATTTTINWNNIVGNTEYGVENMIGTDVNAECNWWGDISGPSHSPGTGDKVSANVDYDPWLTAAYPTCISPDIFVNITAPTGKYYKNGDEIKINATLLDGGAVTTINVSFANIDSTAGEITATKTDDTYTITHTISTSNIKPDGEYTIPLIAILIGSEYRTTNSTLNLTLDNSGPAVNVIQPNGGEEIPGNSTYDIKWTATNGELATNPITIYRSANNGGSWTQIATNVPNTGRYSWTVPNTFTSSNCLVKVEAKDKLGNTMSDTSDSVFTITQSTSTKKETIPAGGTGTVEGPTGSDTTVEVTATGEVTVTVAYYEENPHPEAPKPAEMMEKYFDVAVSDKDNVTWPMYVEMHYTDGEIPAGVDESTLGLYYYKEGAWHRCSDTGVNTDENYVWANLKDYEYTGVPLNPGGSPPPLPVPEFNPIGLLALIGILTIAIAFATLRKRK